MFAERVYDLPSVITIDPISDVQPSALQMLRNGFVTFGVFNRIDKISDEVVAVWSKLLRAVAGSRIVVKHLALDEAFLRDGLVGRFVAQGVPQDRVICIGSTERRDHLRAFENIDISLDPFPQNGGISTSESLYMGVPVIAKLGNGAASRFAGGILTAIGLDDWVADNDDGYIAIAQKYASMAAHLEKLRTNLPVRSRAHRPEMLWSTRGRSRQVIGSSGATIVQRPPARIDVSDWRHFASLFPKRRTPSSDQKASVMEASSFSRSSHDD
jgi:predicted O-linked N-acetylglucosamine transferase (SPINDLY family)